MNKIREKIMGMAFFGPALVLLTLFLFIPMILTLIFSFTDFFTLNPSATKFVGLRNYTRLFNDELFGKAFFNTIKFALVVVPLQMGGALLLALGINKVTHCKKYFKIAFFIPVVMSLAVVSTLWMQIYSPEGILNNMLNAIGISSQPFIFSKDQALNSISALSIWQGMGYHMIIFLGGLKAISPSLYEAAEIDGANAWKTLFKVKIPMVMSSVTVCLFLTLSNSFKLFDQNLALTNGQPYGKGKMTEMLALNIYNTFYARSGKVWKGYGQAKAVIFCIVVMAISLIQLKATRSKEVQQ